MLIEARGIGLQYGIEPVLQDLSFSLMRNQTYACIGSSGCGKTTLLHLLAGLQSTSTGTLHTHFSHAYPVSVVLQQYGLFPWKKVKDNITLGYQLRRRLPTQTSATEFPMALVQQLGLEKLLHKWPRELSGGQQQRVALARALAQNPEILLLDEPFSALDMQTRETLQDLVKSLQQVHGFTLFLVTHDLSEAAYLGQHIWIMPTCVEEKLQTLENPLVHQADFRAAHAYFHVCRQLRRLVQTAGDV